MKPCSKERGQIISMDLLISMILVVFAMGLLLQYFQTSVQYVHEDGISKDIRQKAIIASDLLVSNPEFICKISNDYGHMLNCIDTSQTNLEKITRDSLGLEESAYKCRIDGLDSYCTATSPKTRCCDVLGSEVQNYYSVKRQIAILGLSIVPGQISKSNYLDCLNGSCSLAQSEITITVWR